MLDWTQCPAVERVPERVSGAWVFKDTRVPVRALFENLEGGATIVQFLEWFPGVTCEQVEAVLVAPGRAVEPFYDTAYRQRRKICQLDARASPPRANGLRAGNEPGGKA